MAETIDSASTIYNERDLIETYLAPLSAGYPGAFKLRDDAAVLTAQPGMDYVLSTDPIVAGVHFFATDRADDIAWKALAQNVSDIVAKGAEPVAYLMALALPEPPLRTWMADFSSGLAAAQAQFGCHLIGGDTDRTAGPLTISVTVIGRIPKGAFVSRSGGRAGDRIFVTGTLGDAAFGLALRPDGNAFGPELTSGDISFLIGRYLRPAPRTALAPIIADFATASIDISDGFVKDLGTLAHRSGLGAMIDVKLLPRSPPAQQVLTLHPDRLKDVLTGGGDYEIIFTISPDEAEALKAAAAERVVSVTEVGELCTGSGINFSNADFEVINDLGRGGWEHF